MDYLPFFCWLYYTSFGAHFCTVALFQPNHSLLLCPIFHERKTFVEVFICSLPLIHVKKLEKKILSEILRLQPIRRDTRSSQQYTMILLCHSTKQNKEQLMYVPAVSKSAISVNFILSLYSVIYRWKIQNSN